MPPTISGDDHREREQRVLGVGQDGVDVLRGEVAEQREQRRPHPRAEDAVRRELPVGHPRAAGDERGQRPDEADEAADQDRLAAVSGEVVLDLLEPLRRDPQPRPVPHHPVAAEPLAEQEAAGVAEEGAEPDDSDRQHDRGRALAGDGAGEHDDRLARRDRARRTRRSRGRRGCRRSGRSTSRASPRRPRAASGRRRREAPA